MRVHTLLRSGSCPKPQRVATKVLELFHTIMHVAVWLGACAANYYSTAVRLRSSIECTYMRPGDLNIQIEACSSSRSGQQHSVFVYAPCLYCGRCMKWNTTHDTKHAG